MNTNTTDLDWHEMTPDQQLATNIQWLVGVVERLSERVADIHEALFPSASAPRS